MSFKRNETIHENNHQILEVFTELRKEWERGKYRKLIEAKQNEQMILGRQFSAIDAKDPDVFIPLAWWDDVPQMTANLLGNIALTWTTLLTKNRPSATAVSKRDDVQAQISADISRKLIDYFESELDLANLMHQIVGWGAAHGTAGFKVYLDVATDSLAVCPVSIFDYAVQYKPKYEQSDWVIFREYIDHWKAAELLDSVGIEEKNIGETAYESPSGESVSGIEKWEIWYRPCFRFPKGFYACLVDGVVIEAMEYPFVFVNEDTGKDESFLPLVTFKCRDERGSPYGRSFISDCVHLQRGINEIRSRLFKLMRQTSSVYSFIPKQLYQSEDFNEESGIIVFDEKTAEMVSQVRYSSPPNINPLLFDQRSDLEKKIYDVAGVNELQVGTGAKSISGRSAAYQSELDGLKNADAVKSLESMTLRFWTLALKIVQKFYVQERTINISNSKSPLSITFNNADISGIDIRLEPASDNDNSEATKQEDLKERLGQGLITQGEYGLKVGGVDAAVGMRLANDIIDDLLAGKDVQITKETLLPEIFITAIQKRIEQAYALPVAQQHEQVKILKALMDTYLRMLNKPAEAMSANEMPVAAGDGGGTKPLPGNIDDAIKNKVPS